MSQSSQRLAKLKLLSQFFQNATIVSICIKTELLHDFFRQNKNLDCTKLDLFHAQYTDSVLELLRKIKKQKEHNLLAIYQEIEANNLHLEKVEAEGLQDFSTQRKLYSGVMSLHLRAFYQSISEASKNVNWEDVLFFYKKYAFGFYRLVGSDFDFGDSNTRFYHQDGYQIESKLAGKLFIQGFKVRFICGYSSEKTPKKWELFRIFQTQDYFIFDILGKKMFLLSLQEISQMDISPNVSNSQSVAFHLKKRNEELEGSVQKIKQSFPLQAEDVLKDYLASLEEMDQVHHRFEINQETAILRAMLNLKLN